ncbi:hypothetical protein BVRB_026900, partial [Beta vulgaris subsp. vulgaris]
RSPKLLRHQEIRTRLKLAKSVVPGLMEINRNRICKECVVSVVTIQMVIADSMLPIVTIVLAASALLHLGHGAADLPPRPKPLTPDKDSRSSSSSGRSTPGLHYPPIIQMPADIKRTATAFAVLVRHLQELSPEGVLAVGWDLGIAKSELPNYQSLCGGRTSRTIASHEAFTKIYRLSSMYIRVDSKRGMRPNLLAAALHYVVHDHHNNA